MAVFERAGITGEVMPARPVEFSDDHRVQSVLHERTDDGTTYKPSMTVTLIEVD